MTLQNKKFVYTWNQAGEKEEQDPREQQLAYLKKHEEEIKGVLLKSQKFKA